MLKRLVIASNNPGKIRELSAMLSPLGIEVMPQSDHGVPEAEEPHPTFIENALAKARQASRHTGLPALADDSGICVDALQGRPGVRSARFAEGAFPRDEQDRRNNEKLLSELKDCVDRRAHYCCVLALVRHPDDPRPLIVESDWHGEVLAAPRGGDGFGYDPLFLLPQLGKTGAELEPAEKNAISHRGKALAELVSRLRNA